MEQQGIVSVFVPLPDGTTFFFAGTGYISQTQIQMLASQTLPHSSNWLALLTSNG